MKYGVQFYSWRKYLNDEAGCRFAFQKAKELGSEVVQISGSDFLLSNPALLASLSKEYGIDVCVTHSPFERIANDIDALCEEHLSFGCTEIGIGAMPREYRSADKISEFKDIVNAASERAATHGVTVAYHNHDFEKQVINGKMIFDHLKETKLNFIPDSYWLKVCGFDVCDFLRSIDGRVNTLHLKDYKKFLFRPIYTTVGKGKLDFAAILKTAEEIGVKYSVVEIDIARDPIKSVTESMQYLERFRK